MASESERTNAMSTSFINNNQHNVSESISENSSITQEFDSLYDNDLQYDYDAIGEYFFESARLAYKADPDYKNLVQAIVVMEAGRHQAQKDLNNLSSHRKRAATSPLDFVEKIESKENFGISKIQKIDFVPSIDWDKYGLSRNANISKDSLNSNSTTADETGCKKDRGKKFSQSWTQAEQSRLEDLLLVYPPEEIESRRWEKISFALGTRTPSQVASRVQKYFLKLLRAGVPIPGRLPNPKSLAKNSRHETSVQNGKASTQNNNCKEDKNKITSAKNANDSSSEDISDLEDINPSLKSTSEYKELLFIKKVLRKKMNSAKHKVA